MGRVTIEVFGLNRERLIAARKTAMGAAWKDVLTYVRTADDLRESVERWLKPEVAYAAAVRQSLRRRLSQQPEASAVAIRPLQTVTPLVPEEKQNELSTQYDTSLRQEEQAAPSEEKREARMRARTRYITRVVLHNCRIIEDITINFPEPEEGKKSWIVLLGENATGKST